MPQNQEKEPRTESADDAVDRIVAEDEAGIGDALRVVEATEEHYFPAAAAVERDPAIVTGSTTSSA